MFLHITNVTKQKIIQLFEERKHEVPELRDLLVSNKMPSTKDLPSKALIVTSASANQKKLSNDDFIQDEYGYTALGRIIGKPGLTVEWIQEDRSSGAAMAPPGYYYLTVTQIPGQGLPGLLEITPVVRRVEAFQAPVQKALLEFTPIGGNVRVRTPHRSMYAPSQYVYDAVENAIVLSEPLVEGHGPLTVEYLYAAESLGSFEFRRNAELRAIPGVILAIGERYTLGDQQVLFIDTTPKRQYMVHGGQWEMSLELTAYAQDPGWQERIIDYAATWMWRDRIAFENSHIAVQSVSIGGDSTETEVEIAELPLFTASLSLEILTTWEIHSPYLFEWREILMYEDSHTGAMTDDEAAEVPSSLIPVLEIGDQEVTFDNRPRLILPGLQTI